VKSKKKRRKPRHRAPAKSALLDAFTERDLEVWETRSIDLQSYHDRVYYDLERQRAARYEELCVALRAATAREVLVDRWVRVTDWRWSLTPLSAAGSLNEIGGRFNIGGDLDRARGQAFPCLYIAEDVETAYREYFGGPLTSRPGKLSLSELALRRETSFVTFSAAWPARACVRPEGALRADCVCEVNRNIRCLRRHEEICAEDATVAAGPNPDTA